MACEGTEVSLQNVCIAEAGDTIKTNPHTSPDWLCRPIQRRPHKKSRNGCRTCKIRHIKCDEVKPSCTNCTRSAFTCDFETSGPVPFPNLANTSSQRKRGRPVKTRPATFLQQATERDTAATKPDIVHNQQNGSLNVDDIQLFHHYMSDSFITSDDDDDWRGQVPCLSFAHHYVLRLILALSAFHLTRCKHTESDRYEKLAESHLSIAIREVMDLLPQLDQKNCSALYVATVLICRCIFAKTRKKGDLLVVADGDQVAWWESFRGVRFIVETMGVEVVMAGLRGSSPTQQSPKELPIAMMRGAYVHWEEPLDGLMTWFASFKKPYKDLLESMRLALSDCFRGVFGTAEEPLSHTRGKSHIVMRWLYFIEDDFVAPLKGKSPPALVLLAYFAVLLRTLDHVWYMEGWAQHILEGIEQVLDASYAVWLLWPTKQLQIMSVAEGSQGVS